MIRITCSCLLFFFASAVHAENLALPFKGTWYVFQAGDTLNVNHHMSVKSQWYGVDFVKLNSVDDRRLHKSDGKKLSDYFTFGEKVYSPADGELVFVHDGEIDQPIGASDKNKPAGNYVVIKTQTGKYVFIAHFKKNTIKVKAGEKIRIGDFIGEVGNSGNTTMPHIHIHTQDTKDLFTGTGVNMIFQNMDVWLTKKLFKNVDWPLLRGLIVRPHSKQL